MELTSRLNLLPVEYDAGKAAGSSRSGGPLPAWGAMYPLPLVKQQVRSLFYVDADGGRFALPGEGSLR